MKERDGETRERDKDEAAVRPDPPSILSRNVVRRWPDREAESYREIGTGRVRGKDR